MNSQETDKRYARFALPAVMLGIGLVAAYVAVYRPGYLSNGYYLGGLIFLQILLATVWDYRQRFFLLLVIVFFWAGTGLPFNGVWTAGRWWVLSVGAIAGFALYMRDQQHRFGVFHLIAFFCAVAALVSASVSSFPTVSSLKALSLLLLFLYGSTGARLALAGREERFFRRLLFAVEILVYVSAVAYLVLRIPVYGNPNSMGAIMGVIAVPILFWGVLISEGRIPRRRAIFAFFLLRVGLMFYSQARAGILAGTIACFLTCVALRRYRLLIQGILACMAIASLAILMTPADPDVDMPSASRDSSIVSTFLYKGKEDRGLLGSRGDVWDETVSVIRAHPWFGSGFGTSVAAPGEDTQGGWYSSSSATTKEHGDSYLAILEGVGLLGSQYPFFAIVLMLGLKIKGVFVRLRRTLNFRHSSVPVAMVLVAGLIHACFEDWLFAVGYYLPLRFLSGSWPFALYRYSSRY